MLKSKKLALVVDDSKMQCKLLSVLLEEENYRVFFANDGASGVKMYIKHQPDLVLMDINMPIMDGFEATRRIKKLSKVNTLAPIIFITSMDSDQAFIDSVDAGGDSILVRPFTPNVFKAKIKAIQRISDLVNQVKGLQQEQQKDAELAEKMMRGVVEAKNFALDKIGVIKKAATIFSGDIQLSALCPNGDINVLLGDFTGHGLRASIGAIPVTEVFRTMTKKGFALLDIIAQINRQMYALLPGDLFFAVCFASISEHEKSAYIFNAGLPDGYLFDESANIKRQFTSTHPPLGILPQLLPDAQLFVTQVINTDRLVFITDGIVEARNKAGELFGFPRFEKAAVDGIKQKTLVNSILTSLDDFCQNCEQEDDISLVDVPCSGWQKMPFNKELITSDEFIEEAHYFGVTSHVSPTWSYHLHLTGKILKTINPIPLVMNQINEIEGAGEHWQSLYTILTELFINALDHGVLGLNSSLKNSPEGFSQYFKERANRLDMLSKKSMNEQDDFVRITLEYFPFSKGGKMVINIKDSGVGFDILHIMKDNSVAMNQGVKLSGRGVELVNQLCDTLEYEEQGTFVTASYIWHD
jgi:CheY-like chemotaxis protein/two-component sensor histidine kinase